jgi:hypothetical protein
MKRQPFALPYAGIQPFADLSANHASAAPVEPTVGDYFSDALGGLGIPREQALKLGSAFGLFPEGFRESGRALAAPFVDPSAGNIAGAGFEAALTAIPGAKGAKVAADAAEGAVKKGIRGYHGSPHDFDRFDMSKIGTGEGAQAYGHGLYFAENEKVAKGYRDALTQGRLPSPEMLQEYFKPGSTIPGYSGTDKVVAFDPATKRVTVQQIDDAGRPVGRPRAHSTMPNYQEAAKELQRRGIDQPAGRMYEVNINADPEHFLDWDKPFSGQPDAVKDAWKKALAAAGHKDPEKATTSAFASSGMGMENLVDAWNKHDRAKTAETLREAGIPGIRYLDQGSRGAGEGSHNYVVFDDKLVEILRKYGIALPFGLGAAGAGALGKGPDEPETY